MTLATFWQRKRNDRSFVLTAHDHIYVVTLYVQHRGYKLLHAQNHVPAEPLCHLVDNIYHGVAKVHSIGSYVRFEMRGLQCDYCRSAWNTLHVETPSKDELVSWEPPTVLK